MSSMSGKNTIMMLSDMLYDKEKKLILAHNMKLSGMKIDKKYMEFLIEEILNYECLLNDAIELTKII